MPRSFPRQAVSNLPLLQKSYLKTSSSFHKEFLVGRFINRLLQIKHFFLQEPHLTVKPKESETLHLESSIEANIDELFTFAGSTELPLELINPFLNYSLTFKLQEKLLLDENKESLHEETFVFASLISGSVQITEDYGIGGATVLCKVQIPSMSDSENRFKILEFEFDLARGGLRFPAESPSEMLFESIESGSLKVIADRFIAAFLDGEGVLESRVRGDAKYTTAENPLEKEYIHQPALPSPSLEELRQFACKLRA